MITGSLLLQNDETDNFSIADKLEVDVTIPILYNFVNN